MNIPGQGILTSEPELQVTLFFSCDLKVDPMTFIYKLDLCPLKMYPQTKNKLSTLRMVLQTYIQTYREMPPKHYHGC